MLVVEVMSRRKKRLIFLLIFILILLLLSIGCAAGTAMVHRTAGFREIDKAVMSSGFEGGIQHIQNVQAGRRPLYTEQNSVSLFLDLGLLQHFAGDFRASANSLGNAERLMQEAFTRSITESIATFLVNDNAREYPGEDFEDIYISVFNALNYFKMGNIDGALVEVRKLTLPSGKLDLLARRHEQVINRIRGSAEQELAMRANSDEPPLPEIRSVSFSNSALARYLSILFYQADGNYDAVRVELIQLRQAFASQPNLYNFPIPRAVDNLVDTPPDYARLDIISFAGLSPIKEEEIIMHWFPFFREPILHFPRFKLPKLVSRQNRINRIEVVVDNERFNMELIEDIGAVITDTFNARIESIFWKTYIRTLTKYTALDITAHNIRQRINPDSIGGQLAFAAGVVTALTAFNASERADLRMVRFLPNKAFVGNINLKPGKYDVKVNYFSGRTLIYTEIHRDIDVRSNRVNLIRTINLDIPMEEN